MWFYGILYRQQQPSVYSYDISRLDGTPDAGSYAVFEDVKTNQWYSEAVVWASENGLVNGYSAALSAYAEEAMCWAYGTSAAKPVLSPKDPSTRAQIAAVICRYLQNITAEQ